MNKTFIIAEAGVNHNGQAELAKRLIDEAAHAGVDAIKFQTFKAEKLAIREAPKADYQKKDGTNEESQFEMLKKLELNDDTFKELKDYCNEKGLTFLSSPFDIESLDFLMKLGIEMIKIPSGEITNLPYLRKIGALKREILLSTGMATLSEIETALRVLVTEGTSKNDITVLHCTTEYPAPYDEVNLRAMLTIRDAFNVEVGYSDHTHGIEVPIAAAAMGARVIEKHFTIDINLPGPDHGASLEPQELRAMVRSIRNIENAMGDGIKQPSLSEIKNIEITRKSIIAAMPIKVGDVFSELNITTKRPGNGISPMEWDRVIGKKAVRDFQKDEMITR